MGCTVESLNNGHFGTNINSSGLSLVYRGVLVQEIPIDRGG